MTADFADAAKAWREARRAEALAKLAAGAELPLADAIDFLAPDDWPRRPSLCFGFVVDECAAGRLVASAMGVHVADPLGRREVPAGAWPSARPIPDDFEFLTIAVLNGVLLHDVRVRTARSEPAGRDRQHNTDLDPGENEVETAALPNLVSEGMLPGALLAAPQWLVEQRRAMSADEVWRAFETFGMQLSDDGQRVINAPETIDGKVRSAGDGGRPPSVALLLIEANRGLQKAESIPTGTQARRHISWLGSNFPHLDPPSIRAIERAISQTGNRQARISSQSAKKVERQNPDKTSGSFVPLFVASEQANGEGSERTKK